MKVVNIGLGIFISFSAFAASSANTFEQPTINGRRIKANIVLADYVCQQNGFLRASSLTAEKVNMNNDGHFVAGAYSNTGIAKRGQQILDFEIASTWNVLGLKSNMTKSIECE